MCIILVGRADCCTCVRSLSDKTLVRMCDLALTNKGTTCEMASFPPPEESPANPICPRCSSATGITVSVSSSARKRTAKGITKEGHDGGVHTKLDAKLGTAVQSSMPSISPSSSSINDKALIGSLKDATPIDDEALIKALKEATTFVMVEHENAQEPFNEDGARSPTLDIDDAIDQFLAHNNSSTWLGKEFGMALGNFFFGQSWRKRH